jgi:hypothetical protein
MRTGFRVGTVTYFLETDAIIFWDEVQRLAKVLADSTPGAELTRAMINAADALPDVSHVSQASAPLKCRLRPPAPLL